MKEPLTIMLATWPNSGANKNSVANSVFAVITAVFLPEITYGSTNSDQEYVLYCTAVQYLQNNAYTVNTVSYRRTYPRDLPSLMDRDTSTYQQINYPF